MIANQVVSWSAISYQPAGEDVSTRKNGLDVSAGEIVSKPCGIRRPAGASGRQGIQIPDSKFHIRPHSGFYLESKSGI